MNKIFYAISGFISVVFSWLLYRNRKVERKNCKLESVIDQKTKALNEVENEAKKTEKIIKKQSQAANCTDTSVDAVHDWLSGKE